MTPQKQCRVCKQSYPATKEYFYSSAANRGNLQTICKKCKAVYMKKYNKHYRAPKPPLWTR